MTSKNKKMTRSENMSKIRSTNTSIELLLRRELWKRGLRYRVNYKLVDGKPDIVFLKKKIAIFCDSEFWHGKDYLEGKHVVKTNKDYWIQKLEKNINRDIKVNTILKQKGWTVLRYWGKNILKHTQEIADEIEKLIKT